MTHQEGSFRHAAADQVQVLELPYVGGDLSMLLIVPNERDAAA